MDVPTEAQEQIKIMQWAQYNENQYPELKLLHHIPNGGSRNKLEAVNLKRQGVKRGVPDLCLPVPRKGFHGLYIELKRQKGGKLSKEQKEWLEALDKNGYWVGVAYGADAAIKMLENYLEI